MTAFKGFDDYIEIFKGGVQVDSQGKPHDGDLLIDKALAGFDPHNHEPPLCVGHPADNAPAFGWVAGLKDETRDGTRFLLARFKDVVPEFSALAKQGVYKKRSASFYPDGRLRHVGFLGAAPPAVKGLADIGFGDGDGQLDFEFSDTRPWTWSTIADVFRKLREWIIEKDGKEAADGIIPNWDIDEVAAEADNAREDSAADGGIQLYSQGGSMKFSEFMSSLNLFKKLGGKDEDVDLIAPGTTPANPGAAFSEADIEAAKQAAAAEAKKQATAEFAEVQAADARKRRNADIETWVKAREKKIPPAIRDSGLIAFMQGLGDEEIAFAEGADKQSSLQWFQAFVDTMGESPLFAEIATKGTAGKRTADAEAEFALGKDIGERANK